MSERAEVTSTDAIADFRAALLVYIGKVRPLLDDSADEVFRMREWLRVTQRIHWENQVRVRTREVADAEQALFSAELAKLRPASNAEIIAVQKAKRALAAAEEKLRTLKRAAANFEKEAVPRLKQVENLRGMVATDLREAAHYLDRILGALDKYVNTPAAASGTSTATNSAASGSEPAEAAEEKPG